MWNEVNRSISESHSLTINYLILRTHTPHSYSHIDPVVVGGWLGDHQER